MSSIHSKHKLINTFWSFGKPSNLLSLFLDLESCLRVRFQVFYNNLIGFCGGTILEHYVGRVEVNLLESACLWRKHFFHCLHPQEISSKQYQSVIASLHPFLVDRFDSTGEVLFGNIDVLGTVEFPKSFLQDLISFFLRFV